MNELNDKTCCFTGHRNIPSEQYDEIVKWLKNIIVKLIKKGIRYFGAGGALGFDTIAAQTVLNLKEQYSQIKLILVLPCITQAKNWGNEDQLIYENLKNKADKVVYISKEYYSGCMHKRNRHLIDNSSICICYLNRQSGGTAYTVSYAEKRGKTVINIAKLI